MLLAGRLQTITCRQLHRRRDLLHVVADIARRTAFRVRIDADPPLQVLSLDDLRAGRLHELGDLAERHHAHLPVGTALVRRQIEIAEIGREPTTVLRQLHVDFVVLTVGAEPVADRIAGEQRAQRRADLLDGHAKIGGGIVVQMNRQCRIGSLVGRLEIGNARDLGHLAREFTGEPRQRVRIGTQHVEPDRPIVANRELDARNRFQLCANQLFELELRATALRAVEEPQVDTRVIAAVLGADRRHCEIDLGKPLQRFLDLANFAVGVLEA